MADRLTKEKRSWNMSKIRSRDTQPELAVRSLLHKAGFRFRLDRSELPCKPDIILPAYKTVVFVHGCFWHRHEDCPFAYTPKTRKSFWEKKFQDNVARDRRNLEALHNSGWHVLVVWECELRNSEALGQRLEVGLRKISSAQVKKGAR